MNRQSAQDGILKVDRYLDRVIELLEHMGPEIEKCPAIMREAAECMRLIRRECSFRAEDLSEFGPHIRRVQEKNFRAQELLNSATSFYCGWLAAGSENARSYLPEPESSRDSGSVLIMEA